MRRCAAAATLTAVLLLSSAALAQSAGALTVAASVRTSVLFSGTTPAGATFSQGGEESASATISVAPGSQSFSVRAVVANNPNSAGYGLAAKLAPGSSPVILDGMELSTSETLITAQAPYGISQAHSMVVKGPGGTVILICRPK